MSDVGRLDASSDIASSEPLSPNDPSTVEPIVCPYLGLADDPRTRSSVPAEEHRCHAGSSPASVERAYQGVFCLSSRHQACERYHAPYSSADRDASRRLSVAAAAAAETEAIAEVGYERLMTLGSPQSPWLDRRPATEAYPARETTTTNRDPVGVFPWFGMAATSAVPTPEVSSSDHGASEPVDSELLGAELFATEPPRTGHTTPPPTAWRDASTAAILASILPPVKLLAAPTAGEPTGADLAVATLPPVETEVVGEAPPSVEAGSVADVGPEPVAALAAVEPATRTEDVLPRSTPVVATPTVAAPTVAVVVGPWPIETRVWTEIGLSQPSPSRRRSGRRRTLLVLVGLAVAVAASAIFFAAASGSLDRWLPA